MIISIASDHAGFDLKAAVILHLNHAGIKTEDFGAFDNNPVDYIDTGLLACECLMSNKSDLCILICGSGQGMNIIANKVNGVRAALCHTIEFAKLAKEHNDANVVVLAGRFVETDLALKIVDTFINTPFSNEERHIKRINKIKEYEDKHGNNKEI
jgi:ribose 5-phosphate isomerase B